MVVGSCLSVLFGWFDYTKERIEYNLKPVVKFFYLYIDVNNNSRLWNKYEMRVLLHGACACVCVLLCNHPAISSCRSRFPPVNRSENMRRYFALSSRGRHKNNTLHHLKKNHLKIYYFIIALNKTVMVLFFSCFFLPTLRE